MSEVCEVCDREHEDPRCDVCGRATFHREVDTHRGRCYQDRECLRLGYERTLARADRYQAEFSACKALLIAAQQRAERAEAERAEALARAKEAEEAHRALREIWGQSCDHERTILAQRDEAQRDLRDFKRDCDRMLDDAYQGGKRAEAAARALALREAAEVCEDLSASPLGNGYGNFGNAFDECAQAIRALAALHVEPGAARSTSEPAPQNPPPSPTEDAE